MAIITCISAVAVPALIRSKVVANEASAIGSIRVTSSSQKAYAVSCGFGAYASSYTVLGAAIGTSPAYISADLGLAVSPVKAGYQFTLVAGAGSIAGPVDCVSRPTITAFYASAAPLSLWTGARGFALNADGTVWQLNGSAAPTEPFSAPARPIQ